MDTPIMIFHFHVISVAVRVIAWNAQHVPDFSLWYAYIDGLV